MRLDEGERPSCVKEVEASSSLPFMRTGGSLGCLREITVCVILLCLNETRPYRRHFSIIVRSLERREAEMFLWRSQEALSCELNEMQNLGRHHQQRSEC